MNEPDSTPPHKYYFEDAQNREARVTQFLSKSFCDTFLNIAGAVSPVILCSELNKERYGRHGDVDIVVCKFFNNGQISPENIDKMTAFEIKVSFYDAQGKFHSEKLRQHEKQLKQLKKEEWNQIYLVDIVVAEPYHSWIHP